MKFFWAITVLCAVTQAAWGDGAGRAFPVESENEAINLFQGVNPDLEWDPSNYLVDLAGIYANCGQLNSKGIHQVDRESPEGDSISAIVDNTYGEGEDVNSVNAYIEYVLQSWTANGDYLFLMRGANKFGCSVRPGCRGQVVVACLFSPGNIGREPTIPDPTGGQEALAFTPEEYKLAEVITHNRWDRSHFLENLSGFETSCSMILENSHSFPKAKKEAKDRGMVVFGLFGAVRNPGETQPAIKTILASFKPVHAYQIGCSVIPDCPRFPGDTSGIKMVVVSCIYEE